MCRFRRVHSSRSWNNVSFTDGSETGRATAKIALCHSYPPKPIASRVGTCCSVKSTKNLQQCVVDHMACVHGGKVAHEAACAVSELLSTYGAGNYAAREWRGGGFGGGRRGRNQLVAESPGGGGLPAQGATSAFAAVFSASMTGSTSLGGSVQDLAGLLHVGVTVKGIPPRPDVTLPIFRSRWMTALVVGRVCS